MILISSINDFERRKPDFERRKPDFERRKKILNRRKEVLKRRLTILNVEQMILKDELRFWTLINVSYSSKKSIQNVE